MRRMVWVRRDGWWSGEWTSEGYDREREWNDHPGQEGNNQWRYMRVEFQPEAISDRGGDIPQEILLCVVRRLDKVRFTVIFAI